MRTETRHSLARLALVVSAVGSVLTFLNLSTPPANMPFYLGLIAIALTTVVLGDGRLRVAGIVLVIILIGLAGIEWWRGEQEYEESVHFWKTRASLHQYTNEAALGVGRR